MKQPRPAFDCKICGQCCQGSGGIVATLAEQQKIADYLEMDLLEFQKIHVQRKGDKFFIRNNDHGWCIFFESGKGCAVHPVKPRTCRAWPFFRGNLMDESSFEMAKDFCPGIDPDADFQEFVRQGMKYLQEQGLGRELEDDAGNALRTSDID
ncbi:YkgJ family cysteine cluster protein [Desulfonatronospira sp. MSAO_Bac3]|uniref:YkgJ family cysteine cluster protein n=1 Tax=Desulfonatronospira sp. MSAO_Bac3 TaxID=2293857 RepID=UPI000FEDEB55|nr:YkgJ family cysteine cluster protein [Desulfonatronospira sp. MSAO_Bac3]RQD74071.1 MAG: YkgJ family cysteine cluster protein [Desulfonatronospira sp. MSAO_Bac3]